MASASKPDRHDHREIRDALGDLGGLLGDLTPAKAPGPAAAADASQPARRTPVDDPLAPVFAELASLRLEMERMKAAREAEGQSQGLEGWRFAVLLGLGLILLAAVVVQIVKA